MPLDVRNLVLEVTERCNHKCAHCYNSWLNDNHPRRAARELRREEWAGLVGKVIRDAPISQVGLSGGEPLLRCDVADIAGDLQELGVHVVVITAAALLDESRLRRFPTGCTFESTLFSADATLHNHIAGRPVFARIVENLARLARYGHGLVVSCVLTRFNAHDVTRVIKLAIALGAQAILLNRVNLSRRVFEAAPGIVPTSDQLRASLTAADEAARVYGIDVLVSVPIPPCVVDPAPFQHLHFGWCPRGTGEAYYTVSCTGHVRPCNHSSVVLGDLRTESFQDIITGESAREYWAPVPPECRECAHPLRERCLGGCPAAADECYGTRSRPDPIIERVEPAAKAPAGFPYPASGSGRGSRIC